MTLNELLETGTELRERFGGNLKVQFECIDPETDEPDELREIRIQGNAMERYFELLSMTKPPAPLIHRESDIINWGIARNIIGPDSQSNRDKQHDKTCEEVDELLLAIDEDDTEKSRDAIGDIIVTLVLQAQMWGLTIAECLDAAWDEIKDRRGKMVDGIFVKEQP